MPKKSEVPFLTHSLLLITFLFLSLFVFSQSHADVSKIRNFYQFNDHILSSGQPKAAQLEKASDDGIEVVINIVPSSESIYIPNEADILAKQGIEYLHTPVNWSSPKKSEIDNFLAAMDTVGDRKVLVHCWANARASALVHVYQMTQSSDNSDLSYDELRTVWEDVAGYNLDNNKTWQKVIKDFAIGK